MRTGAYYLHTHRIKARRQNLRGREREEKNVGAGGSSKGSLDPSSSRRRRRGCKAGRQAAAMQFGGKCYAGQKLGNKCELDNFTFYNWAA